MPKEYLSLRNVSLLIGLRLSCDYLGLYHCPMVLDCWSCLYLPMAAVPLSNIDILAVYSWPSLYDLDPVTAVFIL
jgi:hypothetical protein